jgi:Cohesin domain
MREHCGLAAALGVMAIVTGSLANAQADISIDPTSQTTSTGTVVTVDVDITNVTTLYGYQFDLTFNPGILQAMSSTEGTFLPSGGATFFISGTNDNVGGTVAATADTLPAATTGVSGGGELAVFTFDAIDAGASTIGIQNEILLDSNINVISDITTGVRSPSLRARRPPRPRSIPLQRLALSRSF